MTSCTVLSLQEKGASFSRAAGQPREELRPPRGENLPNFAETLGTRAIAPVWTNAYDVSYVDSFALAVAMGADSVSIPNTQPAQLAPFGWVGSSQTIDEVQAAFQNLIGSNSRLGSYFGNEGYPSYYAPSGVDTIKLPSGQKLFFQSPSAQEAISLLLLTSRPSRTTRA